MRRSGGLEVHELHTFALQARHGASDAVAKHAGLLRAHAQPEQLELAVEARDIRKGALKGCLTVEWIVKSCLDGARPSHIAHHRTAERGYVGKVFRVVKSDEQRLHAAHRETGHGAMVPVGEGPVRGVYCWNQLVNDHFFTGAEGFAQAVLGCGVK